MSLEKSDDEISVPENCIKMNEHVSSLLELESLLYTLRFWIRPTFPSGAINFMVNHLDESLMELMARFSDIFPRVQPLLESLRDAKLSKFCDLAARFGLVDFLDCFYKSDCKQMSVDTLKMAAKNGHYECLVYSYHRLCENDNAFVLGKFRLRKVVFAGHLDCLKFLVEHGAVLSKKIVRQAAVSGQLACLQYLVNLDNNFLTGDDLIEATLVANHVNCLQYLVEKNCEVTMLNWETAINSRVTYHDFSHYEVYGKSFYVKDVAGANAGDTSCLQYLLENVPLPEEADEFLLAKLACKHGSVIVLKLLHQRGFPFHAELITIAAKVGSIDCLHFLHDAVKFDCFVPSTMATAAGANQLHLVKELHEMGCSWDESALIAAKQSRSASCLVFLLEQRGVPDDLSFLETLVGIYCKHLVSNLHKR